MHLKSIDIVGYKSFAAKTHLDLGLGITGIIGPNGCGKSNIMESVRWCLGEMSWKSLRADSMVDVIFAGTAKRQPLSMAEVTLTFDNSQNTLPVQFSEVTVSRRLFRSGESAYFLNKTQCRLRDIRELFMDTGLGGGGYAIIDQGGVDFILNSNVEDRRAIFEEAAGVSKYKAKREEALRKLERVEADISRLRDSAVLIDEQVRKLDSDARKAKLYQKYKEELAALEAGQVLRQMSDLDARLSETAGQCRPMEEDLGRLRVEIDGEGARIAALNLEKANAQNEMIAANGRIAETKAGISGAEAQKSFCESTAEDSQKRLDALAAETSGLLSRLEQMDPEMGRAQSEAENARAEEARMREESSGEESRAEELSQRCAQSGRAVEALREEALRAAEAVLSLRRERSRLESDFANQDFAVRQSLRDLEKDGARVSALQQDLDAVRAAWETLKAEASSKREAAAALEAEFSSAREKYKAAAEAAAARQSGLTLSRARLEAAETRGRQNPYWTGAQAVLGAGIPGVMGMVGDILRAPEDFAPHLEDALGERLYAVVCEDSVAAKACVEFLRATGRGRGRFLVLSTISAALAERSYPPESLPLLSRLNVSPAHEAVARFLLGEVYSLDKALFADHWVCGGSDEALEDSMGPAHIGVLREAIAQDEAECSRLAAEKADIEADIARKEAELAEARAALALAEAEEKVAAAQIGDRTASLDAARQSAAVSEAEAAQGLKNSSLIKEEMAGKNRGIAELESAEAEAKAREAAAGKEFGNLREEAAAARAGLEAVRSRLKAAQEKTSFLEKDLQRLAQEKSGLEDLLSRRERERAELEAKKTEMAAKTAELEARRQALVETLSELEISAQGKASRLQDMESAAAQKEESLRGLRDRAEELQAKLHALEVENSSLRATREALSRRLSEELGLSADEAREKYGTQSAEPEKIEFLKRRVASLGNVNMAAPEEYEALTARQSYLASQIDDLNKAEEDLKSAIQKINSATRENFRQTFSEVREHFRRLFSVLFEGGEADLILSDPDNMLESGIEIMAQPPGKRLQNITLLSGGEKTLTAIALLFAFFLVKPSPFCMMDEADAALDDANVERFGQLLKEFEERTQFLIVSHNKRTMEAADVIYGVTMEEMGVSQIVSVDLRRKSAATAAPAAAQPSSDPARA
ncbi:MAG TPA: chromosome segregation protein SMC [Elusimicrobiota bacterium]|nr:chromosome segregation protein SMC [Elusimicrobiota bacterium]